MELDTWIELDQDIAALEGLVTRHRRWLHQALAERSQRVLFTVAGMVFVLGVMALWTFSFDEMGDAVRALGE
jgi:hypothetical protein